MSKRLHRNAANEPANTDTAARSRAPKKSRLHRDADRSSNDSRSATSGIQRRVVFDVDVDEDYLRKLDQQKKARKKFLEQKAKQRSATALQLRVALGKLRAKDSATKLMSKNCRLAPHLSDILLGVFKYLKMDQRLRYRRVSTQWCDLMPIEGPVLNLRQGSSQWSAGINTSVAFCAVVPRMSTKLCTFYADKRFQFSPLHVDSFVGCGCHNIRRLEVDSMEVDQVGRFSALSILIVGSLSGYGLSQKSADIISCLEYFAITGTSTMSVSILERIQCTALKILRIRGTYSHENSIASLFTNCPCIEELEINDGYFQSFPLKKLQSLKKLALIGCHWLTNLNDTFSSVNTTLVSLTLSYCGIENLQFLKSLRSLQQLNLHGCWKMTDACLTSIFEKAPLVRLRLGGTQCSLDAVLEVLKQRKYQLEELWIGSQRLHGSTASDVVTPSTMKSILQSMPSLRKVILLGYGISDDVFDVILKDGKQLTHLIASSNGSTPRGIKLFLMERYLQIASGITLPWLKLALDETGVEASDDVRRLAALSLLKLGSASEYEHSYND